jgi:hypothetical protein
LTDLKIPLARLFERRSKTTGLSYLSGRLGDARILCFRETDTPEEALFGADAVWQCYVSPADQGYQQRLERRQRPALTAVPVPARWRHK